jgi:tRNA uridine 5-carboxymethylaminomethyl modification enzyme
LPLDLDYKEVHGLSAEAQQKLNLHKPENLGQASRISGITPATISLLLVFIKRKNKPKKMTAKRPAKAA